MNIELLPIILPHIQSFTLFRYWANIFWLICSNMLVLPCIWLCALPRICNLFILARAPISVYIYIYSPVQVLCCAQFPFSFFFLPHIHSNVKRKRQSTTTRIHSLSLYDFSSSSCSLPLSRSHFHTTDTHNHQSTHIHNRSISHFISRKNKYAVWICDVAYYWADWNLFDEKLIAISIHNITIDTAFITKSWNVQLVRIGTSTQHKHTNRFQWQYHQSMTIKS